MIVEKIVFVFDICSSTNMMEDAQITSSLDSYTSMIKDIKNFLKKVENDYNFEIYKFLGDGFILLFDHSVTPEKIYKFSEELVDIVGKIISIYIKDHIQNTELPRKGITIGVDSGILDKSENEYVGRAINIACRLQGKLDATDSVNRIIISKKIYSIIKDIAIKKQFEYKPKTLKNVNGGKEVPCYESSPLVGKKDKTVIIKQGKKIDKLYYTPSAESVIEAIERQDKFGIQIRRSNGKIVYLKDNYSNQNEVDKTINNLSKNKMIRVYRKQKK
jgi:hypothetical protein